MRLVATEILTNHYTIEIAATLVTVEQNVVNIVLKCGVVLAFKP